MLKQYWCYDKLRDEKKPNRENVGSLSSMFSYRRTWAFFRYDFNIFMPRRLLKHFYWPTFRQHFVFKGLKVVQFL
ncbi:hypothetical protein Y032_0014g2461 [Ancylostoma ceylanicum]|uniref:Uncharacterized protein n=1 Tax=Ancylostoma ceylanicum TaxID=53326 RepID=A0A016VA75_9BILA|nr:hypothetical protein Y032_0014g2461 [Ancylostoma ceylanicum]